MTQITPEQQQVLDAAAKSVADKLETFHEGLAPVERLALDITLRQAGAQAPATTDDVGGYSYVIRLINKIDWNEVYKTLGGTIDWNKAMEGQVLYIPS